MGSETQGKTVDSWSSGNTSVRETKTSTNDTTGEGRRGGREKGKKGEGEEEERRDSLVVVSVSGV